MGGWFCKAGCLRSSRGIKWRGGVESGRRDPGSGM